MKPFFRLRTVLFVLILLASCASCAQQTEDIPDLDTPLAGPSAPTLPTVGMEPEEVAVAFVEAYLRTAYLYEDDAFTQYTAAAMAEFDPAGGAVMNGEPVTYEALKRNARYWQEKAKWFRYIRAEQGIFRKDFAAPCTSGVTDSGEDWANVTVSGMLSFTYADSGESGGMEFNFDLNIVRTDHRTSYAWVVGDAVEPLDSFDAEHKNDAEFSADALIEEYERGAVLRSGDGSAVRWAVLAAREDRTPDSDGTHGYDVRILELYAPTVHLGEINRILRDEPLADLEEYLRTEHLTADVWRLNIESEVWEENGLFAASVYSEFPHVRDCRLRNVFWDPETDALLSADEFIAREGLPKPEEAALSLSGPPEGGEAEADWVFDGLRRLDGGLVYLFHNALSEDGIQAVYSLDPAEEAQP